MSILIDNVKINNFDYTDGSVVNLPLNPVTINWEAIGSSTIVRQKSVEFRFSTSKTNWGKNSFIGSVFSQPITESKSFSFSIRTKFLDRGSTYYGQFRLLDTENNLSDWFRFAFTISLIPFVRNVKINPSNPSIEDDLVLDYDLFESNSVKIRWFRNGIHQTSLDNFDRISSDYLRYQDTWFAQITPFNNMENGSSSNSNSVNIAKLPPFGKDLLILPQEPTTEDFYEASFSVLDSSSNSGVINDQSKIQWFVNDTEIPEAENEKFVRFDVNIGDEIYFVLTPNDGLFEGSPVRSPTSIIRDPGFRINNIRVDNVANNLNVKSSNPTIEYDILEPPEKIAKYVKINIGTSPGANNIFSTIVESSLDKFTIPDNVIRRGSDYFISIAASDTVDNFRQFSSSQFRMSGSLWMLSVNNSTGWTIEASLRTEGESYQKLSISDGSYFAEIRFFNNSIDILFGNGNVLSHDIDTSITKNYIITGKNNTLKVYENNNLILDGSELFTQPSSEKFIDAGGPADQIGSLFLQRLSYTTEGSFSPIEDSEVYADLSLQNFIDFAGSEIADITEFQGDEIVSVNPSNDVESGSIYRIVENQTPVFASTDIIDEFDIELFNISSSPDERFTYFCHSLGVSHFDNFYLASFDLNLQFAEGVDPSRLGWELLQTTPFPAASFTSNGLIIDTTFNNTSRVDDRLQRTLQIVPALSIEYVFDQNLSGFDFSIEITDTQLTIYNQQTTVVYQANLNDNTVQDIADDINNSSDDPFFLSVFIRASTASGVGDQLAKNLNTLNQTNLSVGSSLLIDGEFLVFDPYELSPYSKTSGGKWFYTQRRPGSPWFDKVDNAKGWICDFDLTVEAVEDSDRPSNVSDPEGVGLFFADGRFSDNLEFLPQEIICKYCNKQIAIDNTQTNQFRLSVKDNNLCLYAKKPTDLEYKEILQTKLSHGSTNEANAGQPRITSDNSGNLYAVWHDDGVSARRQIYFSENITGEWSDPIAILSNESGGSNPDIAVDSNGIIYVVFESNRSDFTEISVLQRTPSGWSDPFFISSDIGRSLNPKVDVDKFNNVHVCWEDYRFVEPEIFYCRRNGRNGQWESSAFGYQDTRISNSPSGASNPFIITSSDVILITFTAMQKDGSSYIHLAKAFNGENLVLRQEDAEFNTSWISSGQGASDQVLSGTKSRRADYSSMTADARGRVWATWHDQVNTTFQIFVRDLNPRASSLGDILQITNNDLDTRYPSISHDVLTGNIYIAFEIGEKGVFNPGDPYNPYDPYQSLDDPIIIDNEIRMAMARYNAQIQRWESSNQTHNSGGGFDLEIEEGDRRISKKPALPKRNYASNISILYETKMVRSENDTIDLQQQYSQVREVVFDHTWSKIYRLPSGDPYLIRDTQLSAQSNRKEIRFGDFSNTLGVRYRFNKIRYYLDGDWGPFNIRLVSPSTTNMPSVKIFDAISNNAGDAWLATSNGLMFYEKRKNRTFVFRNPNFGLPESEIKRIEVNESGDMFVATNNTLFLSKDHVFFYKVTNEDLPSSIQSIAVDKDKFYVGGEDGLYIYNVKRSLLELETSKEDALSTDKEIIVDFVQKIDTNSGLSNNFVKVIQIDANGIVWIGTRFGLNRYQNNSISSFFVRDGLSSNNINDISIKDTATRYIATTSGIDRMLGVQIDKLDLSNAKSVVFGETNKKPDDRIPKLANVKSVLWREPNVLFINTINKIYQLELRDEGFGREAFQLTRFSSQDFTLSSFEPLQNDEIRTLRIVGTDNIELSDNIVFQVLLNGRKINRGFDFSPKQKIIRFKYPLKESDIVQIILRPDLELLNNFSQNKAQKIALGNRSTKIEKLLASSSEIFAQTGGDVNSVQINDVSGELPFDRIVLDTEPPQGKIRIGPQISPTAFRVFIDRLPSEGSDSGEEYLPFDSVSGIDKLIVSNFTNFTTDGETPQNPQPFTPSVDHDLGVIFESITKEHTFEGDAKGTRLKLFNRLDGSQFFVAGTASPAQIWIYDPSEDEFVLNTTLDEDLTDTSIEFIESFNGQLVVGTGRPNGTGKIWTSLNASDFNFVGSISGSHAYTAEILENILYIGGGDEPGENGFGGALYSWDGSSLNLVLDKISGAITDLVAAQGELYAGTGDQGRIYRLDPLNVTQQIVDTFSDPRVLSIDSALAAGDKRFVFAGYSQTSQIRRSLLPDGAFTNSFRTIEDPVYSMENINDILYAAIGKTLYALENVWNAQFTHTEDIKDIALGPGQVPWFISDNFVFKVGKTSTTKNVYLKLIDRAGNETNLFTDESQTDLDSNLFDSITIEELVSFTNQNRLLEVDEFGNTTFVYDGDDRFYSGDRIDVEQASYLSEIFNGTNNLVSWDKILWDATVPQNTNLKVLVRTAGSRDEILDSDFNIEFSHPLREADISFLSGQFIQFKVIMTSQVRGLSPSLRSVTIKSIASQSTHFFTTNFVLPSKVKSGIMTSTKMIPISSDIIFGINTNDNTDFANYQIIDENRIFQTNDNQSGKNIRVGIKFITPTRGASIAEDFGETGPYNSELFLNSVSWTHENSSENQKAFHFRVSFFETNNFENLVYTASSADSVSGFSDRGNPFSSTGSVIGGNGTASYSFVPVGENPLVCNQFYWVKVDVIDDQNQIETILTDVTFVESCGTTFIDNIDFNFENNQDQSTTYQFRIRFYNNPERTDLFKTVFSGNDISGWFANDQPITDDGVTLAQGDKETISFEPDLSEFDPSKIFYLSIDAFDGSEFKKNNNSFTFRARDIDSSIYCGPYLDVPVLKNLSFTFELEGNEFVTLKANPLSDLL